MNVQKSVYTKRLFNMNMQLRISEPLMVNFNCVMFCTTKDYFYPFALPSYKKREEEKENKVAKPV